jgi:hypothetical protein
VQLCCLPRGPQHVLLPTTNHSQEESLITCRWKHRRAGREGFASLSLRKFDVKP